MAIDLLKIEPHKVSTDLSGYITFIYGAAKVGKTTLATQMPDALLLAFEKGYNALPGVLAQDVLTWGEMKQVVRELKKPEVKEKFKTLVIDTADIAAECCQKYICSQLGIENMGEGGWSVNSWPKYKREIESVFRSLTQMGYAITFISHEKEKEITLQDGTKYNQICPSLQSSAAEILINMSDIVGYAHPKRMEDGTSKVVLTLRSPDNSVVCGGRFKYIEPEIDFNYESLANALNQAIEKEAKMNNDQFITSERNTTTTPMSYDYAALRREFEELAGELMERDSATNEGKIVAIITEYLGKGKRIEQTGPEQAELLYLIVDKIKTELM